MNNQEEMKLHAERTIKALIEIFDRFKKAAMQLIENLKKLWNAYINVIMKFPPKERYKHLKRLGVTNYEPFFKREGIHRCRNNC